MWTKSTSTHVANWRTFSVTRASMGQLLILGVILGFVWGIGVAKLYGLPGDTEREMRGKWSSRVRESLKLKEQICKERPTSTICSEKDSVERMK